jgi:hypothetical protein
MKRIRGPRRRGVRLHALRDQPPETALSVLRREIAFEVDLVHAVDADEEHVLDAATSVFFVSIPLATDGLAVARVNAAIAARGSEALLRVMGRYLEQWAGWIQITPSWRRRLSS